MSSPEQLIYASEANPVGDRDRIMDPRVAKTSTEWWARRRLIELARAALAAETWLDNDAPAHVRLWLHEARKGL